MKKILKIVKFALLGLLITSSMNAVTIKFKTSDGVEFEMDENKAKQSGVIKNMIEISDPQQDPISLTNIKSEQMNLLMPCWDIISNFVLSESEKHEQLITKIKSYNLEQQRQLLLAVNFLNIPEIFNETIDQLSNSPELIGMFQQNPQYFSEKEEFNPKTNFLPFELRKQLANRIKSQIYLFSELKLGKRAILDAKIDNNIIILSFSDHTYKAWKINSNNTLQPIEIYGHEMFRIMVRNGTIVASLGYNAYRFWTVSPDGTLSDPQTLQIAGHRINYARATNGNRIISVRLDDDNNDSFFIIKPDNTLQQLRVAVPNHTINKTFIDHEIIIAKLEDNTYRFWIVNPDGTLSAPQILQVDGHNILDIKINNGIIAAKIDDLTWSVWNVNKDRTLSRPQILNRDIYDLEINNGIIVAEIDIDALGVWKVNEDGTLSKYPQSVLQVDFLNIALNHGVLAVKLVDRTWRVWKINEDGTLTKHPQILQVAGHSIQHIEIGSEIIIAELYDDTWSIFTNIIPTHNFTLEQALFIKACIQEPVNLDSNPEIQRIFNSLTVETKDVLVKNGFVIPTLTYRITNFLDAHKVPILIGGTLGLGLAGYYLWSKSKKR